MRRPLLCATLKQTKAPDPFYLEHQRVPFGHVLLRCHVEEGETHTQAVKGIVRVSLAGLDVLA